MILSPRFGGAQITDKAHLKQERGFVSNLGLLKTHFEFLTPQRYWTLRRLTVKIPVFTRHPYFL